MKIDILIKNGIVYDGTGSKPFKGDIGILGEKIVLLEKEDSKSLRDNRGKTAEFDLKPEKIIEAENLSVAPGFIDTHSHSDFTLIASTRAEGKICQGITTEINGNCGFSAAPLFGKVLERREADLKEFGIYERWSTFEEYFKILSKKGISINFATLVGHGNIRSSVAGYEDR